MFRKALIVLSVFGLVVTCAVVASAGSILLPGDPILASSSNSPANEGVANVIDATTDKYLNFDELGTGFAVTPMIGPTFAQGLRLYTANDAVERDPASYELWGSNVGFDGPYSLISSGPLALPDTRNVAGQAITTPSLVWQEVSFTNSTAYTTYKVIFPTVKNAGAANSMQIGEVQILGEPVPEPSAIVLGFFGLVGLLGWRIARRR